MEILMVDVLFIEKYWNRDISMLPSLLELRQYKSDSIQSKKIPILKLPLFLITYTAREKARQFRN